MDRMGKTTCGAFGCNRWTRRFGGRGVYLCPAHWAMVPKRLRKITNKSFRRYGQDRTIFEWERGTRLWAKCIAAADKNLGM